MELNIPDAEVELAENLLKALWESNRLDGYFAQEHGGAYGAIKGALITTLACSITTHEKVYFETARDVATRLYEEAIDNGENIAYQMQLWRDGII